MFLAKSKHSSKLANRQGDSATSAKSETATYPTTSTMDVSSAPTLINTAGSPRGDASNASAFRNWADWNVVSDSQPIHTYYQNLSPASPGATAPINEGQDVSAAMFLLLRTGEITSEVFSCPSTQPSNREYNAGANTVQNWASWSGNATSLAADLSYSYENPYPASQAAGGSTTSTVPAPRALDALFMVLRENDGGGARPFTCPSLNAQKWDYGSGGVLRPFRLETSITEVALPPGSPSTKP